MYAGLFLKLKIILNFGLKSTLNGRFLVRVSTKTIIDYLANPNPNPESCFLI